MLQSWFMLQYHKYSCFNKSVKMTLDCLKWSATVQNTVILLVVSLGSVCALYVRISSSTTTTCWRLWHYCKDSRIAPWGNRKISDRFVGLCANHIFILVTFGPCQTCKFISMVNSTYRTERKLLLSMHKYLTKSSISTFSIRFLRKMTKIGPILLAYSNTLFVGNYWVCDWWICTDSKFMYKKLLRHALGMIPLESVT